MRLLKITVVLLAFLGSCTNYLLSETISKESQNLENLRIQLEKNPNKNNELKYLNSFPSTFEKFKYFFDGETNKFNELYNKHQENLNLLWELSKKYPKKVLKIWINIAGGAYGYGYADAIGILQNQFAKYAAINTAEFVETLLTKSRKKQLDIIFFIANKIGHDVYYDYQQILKNLNQLNYKKLYLDFLNAKNIRLKIGWD